MSSFLKSFSAEFPILWALVVLVVIGGTGIFLYGFWKLVLRWTSRLFNTRKKSTESS